MSFNIDKIISQNELNRQKPPNENDSIISDLLELGEGDKNSYRKELIELIDNRIKTILNGR